jgi:hypothetical protein
MDKLFYLQDSRSNLGSNVVFWHIDGCGYGTNLNNLEVYTLADAQSHHNRRNSDVPLLKSLVDELSVSAVDHQALSDAGTEDKNDEYVIQRKGRWNGNDISFVCRYGETYDYSKAEVLSKGEAEQIFTDSETHAIFSKASIDKVARRTFQVDNIDKKAMIKQAGIKLVKPKRSRPTAGKTRGNCPTCGKITWDYNPYENACCSSYCAPVGYNFYSTTE